MVRFARILVFVDKPQNAIYYNEPFMFYLIFRSRMADGDYTTTWTNNKASASYNLAERRRRQSITAQLADMASKWSMILFYWNHIIEVRIWSFVTGVGKEREEEEEESSEADGEIVVKEEQTEENPDGLAARGDEVSYMVWMTDNQKFNAICAGS